ncbi:hypothetical protein N7495_006362 [Penicillium taxi]|uniref:uncharacterized protein n=1 Tax=Penicillium taxi TaxID=168475 RepID=UPI002544DE20|nr:uncharacterized protein N7495_006362 [Penicillium taxi]KAJ5894671.1 hypothetical protein N7495_006362 [Penicillium taxi]
MYRVPSTKEVTPGASVNIVLKADQRTGKQVQGTIANVLTRGNHPRGIKVRLSDGRVGRVQSMMTGTFITTSPSTAESNLMNTSAPEVPSQIIGLDAYVKQGKQKKQRKGGESNTQPTDTDVEARHASAEVITCPVCGEFTGDEAAVAHHVASHFGD